MFLGIHILDVGGGEGINIRHVEIPHYIIKIGRGGEEREGGITTYTNGAGLGGEDYPKDEDKLKG